MLSQRRKARKVFIQIVELVKLCVLSASARVSFYSFLIWSIPVVQINHHSPGLS